MLVMTTMLMVVVMVMIMAMATMLATMLMVVVKLNPSGGACAIACFNSLATDDWGRSVGDHIFLHILYHIVCISY